MTHKSAGIEGLSTRQREILELVTKGLTNDEIAGVLKIAPTTVRTHMSQVLARLELTNRTEAAAAFLAWQAGAEPGGASPGGAAEDEPTLVFAHYGPIELASALGSAPGDGEPG